MDIFCSLLEQMKSPRCKAVVGVLQVAKSKSLRRWKELVRMKLLFYPISNFSRFVFGILWLTLKIQDKVALLKRWKLRSVFGVELQ